MTPYKMVDDRQRPFERLERAVQWHLRRVIPACLKAVMSYPKCEDAIAVNYATRRFAIAEARPRP